MACGDAIDLFFARAFERPAHPAIVTDGASLGYGSLARLARRFAAVFARFSEPRVLIALAAGAEAYAAMLGAGLSGRLLHSGQHRFAAAQAAPDRAVALHDAGWPVVCVLNREGNLIAVVEWCNAAKFDRRELVDALEIRLETPAIPKTIHLIDHMPRTENGKIDRRAVVAWLDAGQTAQDGML